MLQTNLPQCLKDFDFDFDYDYDKQLQFTYNTIKSCKV